MSHLLAWVVAAVRRFGWAPIAVFVAHVVMSRVFGVYEDLPGADIPMHLLGGVAIAHFFLGATTLPQATPILGATSRPGRTILAMALVCTSAVIWEFLEWTGDALQVTNAQGGLDDTMLDQLLGIMGGAVYLATRSLVWPSTPQANREDA